MKRIVQTLFLGAGVIALAHCSGNQLVDDSDPNLSGPIGAISIATIHHLEDHSALAADPAGTKTLTNDQGFSLVLEEAAVNWKSVKLISSGEDPECLGGNDQELEIESAENLLGEDLVSSILTEKDVPQVGYCSWQITVAPGPEAAHLKNHGGEDHGSGTANPPIDETFHLAGTWSKDAASGEFHIHSTEPLVLQGNFQAAHDGEVIDHPLHFHEGEVEKQITFGISYDVLLKGLDFSAQTEEQLVEQVTTNLGLAVHQHLGEPAAH
jgi:hypothetical protein